MFREPQQPPIEIIMKYGFVVPVYNHGATLEEVVKSLVSYDFPIIVVDDGNDEKNKVFIRDVEKNYNLVTVVWRKKNGGKGKAMCDGVLKANEMGLTHIFQIDSDGQHDALRVNRFLELSKENPNDVICGYPEYDKNAPAKRVNGRKIANFWVHIVSWDFSIKDALIGFRIYPVKPYFECLKHHAIIDSRMGYDIDILVHLCWKNVKIISESVKVSYPKDGVSNFRMVRDNLHIAGTYTRLCVGMIFRIPLLIAHKIKRGKSEK